MVSTGDLYKSEMSTKDVAQNLREFIKEQKIKGNIPKGIKFSIRSQYFSGGSSIDADIAALPEGFQLLSKDSCRFRDPTDRTINNFTCEFNPEIVKAIDLVEKEANRYNRKDIDLMTDYFDVHFYFHIGVKYDLHSTALKKMYDELRDEPMRQLAEKMKMFEKMKN